MLFRSLRGESITLSDTEAKAILKTLHQQSSARREAEEAAARAAGQVWYAVCFVYGRREEEEFFSLAEAASFLDFGDEEGNHKSDSIRCPDGTVYTRGDTNWDDWAELPALKATP